MTLGRDDDGWHGTRWRALSQAVRARRTLTVQVLVTNPGKRVA